jgi:hypothetical protein
MKTRKRILILAGFLIVSPVVHGQAPSAKVPASSPPADGTIGQWHIQIVQRAREILSSAEVWDRTDTGDCPVGIKKFSIICALTKAVQETAGQLDDPSRAAAGPNQRPALSDCQFRAAGERREGSCRSLLGDFDGEFTIFSVSRAKAITSGVWRKDMQPTEVWAGTMMDAGFPVMHGARKVVDTVGTKKYPGRLSGYNNDPATTFADVQKFLNVLEDQLTKDLGTSDASQPHDPIEIEIYSGGTGIIRTQYGWFPITSFASTDSGLQFRMDSANEVPGSELDREIVQRAAAILTSDAVWNRADNRKCDPAATTWSIYCACEKATIEVTGGFHHRRPAMELVRVIVEERSKGKDYNHRLMGYNNDPSTHLEDVRSIFAEAIARIK